jgi:polyhydroxybutyrate depolymerase
MKKLLLITLVAISTTAFAQFSTQTIDVDGTSRQFRQYLPSGLTSSEHVPLIIALHGMGDDMTNFSGVGFSYFADTARFICLFPQGEPSSLTNASAWNNGTLLSSNVDDIAFINRMIDSMYVRHGIDLSRVYVCGFSMGGIMSYTTTCALPYRIAAMASVSGTMSTADLGSCAPGRAIPVMHMHGTADGTVPYNTTPLPSLSLVPQTLAYWKANNGHTDSTVTPLADAAADNITVDKIEYTGGNAPLNFWRENGADHQWLYTPVNDIDATTEIWLFFRDKVHPAPAMVGVDEHTAPKMSMYYNGSDIVLRADKKINGVEVYDMQGKLICKSAVNNATDMRLPLNNISNQMLIVKAVVNGVSVTKKLIVN